MFAGLAFSVGISNSLEWPLRLASLVCVIYPFCIGAILPVYSTGLQSIFVEIQEDPNLIVLLTFLSLFFYFRFIWVNEVVAMETIGHIGSIGCSNYWFYITHII